MLQLSLWLTGLMAVTAIAVLTVVAGLRRASLSPTTPPQQPVVPPQTSHGGETSGIASTQAAAVPSRSVSGDPRIGLSARSYQTTRRRFLNRSLTALTAAVGIQFGTNMLAFFWPKRRIGSFGSKVDLGDVTDLLGQTRGSGGRITPVAVPAAQAYVVPISTDTSASQFEGNGVVNGGLMVLWHRCVHLGCRVPYCAESQGFECPCHGSKYNLYGEYEAGPAPRNLDRFVITIDDNNRLIADTGQVVETPRARNKTILYPQGPSCI